MEAKQKICLIGGTFDPIHLGHTYIAEKCYRELGMDKIIFLPCKQSPHKLSKKNAPDHHRLSMCKLATSALPWAEVNDTDLVSQPPSYSWRTAELMQQQYPESELYWLMGSDQWEAILRWDRPEYLASMVKFIVISRIKDPQPIDQFPFIHINGAHGASSTVIRKNTLSPQTRAWLHPDVYSYIQSHHDIY